MRNHFNDQLAQLNREMTRMGSECEEIIELVAKAMTGWEDDLVGHVTTLGADIAEIITHLNCRVERESVQIREMAEATIQMVREAVDAYVRQDLELAHTVMKHDDVVDNYFMQIRTSLIDIIRNNPNDGEYALDLLMIAKYCERIGDHCTNIAEWVEFSVTGVHKDCQ